MGLDNEDDQAVKLKRTLNSTCRVGDIVNFDVLGAAPRWFRCNGSRRS
jgi:hypothetical protein